MSEIQFPPLKNESSVWHLVGCGDEQKRKDHAEHGMMLGTPGSAKEPEQSREQELLSRTSPAASVFGFPHAER